MPAVMTLLLIRWIWIITFRQYEKPFRLLKIRSGDCHIHVLFVSPLGTGHMAQPEADQQREESTIREGSNHAGACGGSPGIGGLLLRKNAAGPFSAENGGQSKLSRCVHQGGKRAKRGGFTAQDAAAERADFQPGLRRLPDFLRFKAALGAGEN